MLSANPKFACTGERIIQKTPLIWAGGNSTRLFTNPLTASPLAFTASLPKQKHSRTKSRQLRRLVGRGRLLEEVACCKGRLLGGDACWKGSLVGRGRLLEGVACWKGTLVGRGRLLGGDACCKESLIRRGCSLEAVAYWNSRCLLELVLIGIVGAYWMGAYWNRGRLLEVALIGREGLCWKGST